VAETIFRTQRWASLVLPSLSTTIKRLACRILQTRPLRLQWGLSVGAHFAGTAPNDKNFFRKRNTRRSLDSEVEWLPITCAQDIISHSVAVCSVPYRNKHHERCGPFQIFGTKVYDRQTSFCFQSLWPLQLLVPVAELSRYLKDHVPQN